MVSGGLDHGSGVEGASKDSLAAEDSEGKGDGDPRVCKDPGKSLSSPGPTSGPKHECPGKWSSLFGIKPTGKSSFPAIKVISGIEKGSFSISIPDELVDHNIVAMASTLVSKFIGKRMNIDTVRLFTKKKWDLKGQVLVTDMEKGFMAFEFSFQEDLSHALCAGP